MMWDWWQQLFCSWCQRVFGGRRFTYEALSSPKTQIRLLHLHPRPRDAIIECDVVIVDVENAHDHKYEALSYTWGDPNRLGQIMIGGEPFEVRSNLEIALRNLRFSDKDRILWIDAVCINQQKVTEKNVQVQLMRDVYQGSTRVLAWLGDSHTYGVAGMTLMKAMGRIIYDAMKNKVKVADMGFTWLLTQGIDVTEQDWEALRKLLDRSYWTCVWIIQELASAVEPTRKVFEREYDDRCLIECGDDWMESKFYVALCLWLALSSSMTDYVFNTRVEWHVDILNNFLLEPRMVPREPPKPSPAAFRMFRVLQRTRAAKEPALAKLLALTADFEASDPRDRVYGILAMTPERDLIKPNYSKANNIERMRRSIVRDLIGETGNLQMLMGNRKRNEEGSPSWVPELRGFNINSPAWSHLLDEYAIHANKSKLDPLSQPVLRDLLRVRGTLVGRIEHEEGPFPVSNRDRRGCALEKLKNAGKQEDWKGLSAIENMFGCMSGLRKLAKELDNVKAVQLFRVLMLDLKHKGVEQMGPLVSHEDTEQLLFRSLVYPFKIFIEREAPPPDMQSLDKAAKLMEMLGHVYNDIEENLAERCFFTAHNRKVMGIGPYHCEPGDLIVLFANSTLYSILRPCRKHGEGVFQLIGDAYVRGLSEDLQVFGEMSKYRKFVDVILC